VCVRVRVGVPKHATYACVCLFDNEMYSGMAMSQLQGYKMGDKAFKITFSKS